MRTSTIFRNRWWALLWSAGILWFAYDVANEASGGDAINTTTAGVAGTPAATSDDQQLAAALNSL